MIPSSGISNLGICRQVEVRWISTCLRALVRSALRGGTCSRGEYRRNLVLKYAAQRRQALGVHDLRRFEDG